MIWENSHSVKFREPIWGAPKENVTKSGKSPKGGEVASSENQNVHNSKCRLI